MVRNTEMGTLKLACGRGPWRKGGASLVTVERRRKNCLTLGGQDSCDSKSRCGWGLTGWWTRIGIGGRHFWSLHLGGGRKMVRSTPALATRGDLSETGVCVCLILADVVFCGNISNNFFYYSCPWFSICTDTHLSFQYVQYNKIGFTNFQDM